MKKINIKIIFIKMIYIIVGTILLHKFYFGFNFKFNNNLRNSLWIIGKTFLVLTVIKKIIIKINK